MSDEIGTRAAAALRLRAASERDVETAFEIYKACTAAMLARGILQWDDRYPNRETAAEAARRGDLFLLIAEGGVGGEGGGAERGREGEQIIGSVILNGIEAPEYAPIEWKEAEPALVIHTLVIDPRRQGGGLGRAAMVCCEDFARERGYACVRLDAFPGNPAAIALYERLGYQLRGHVRFAFKPPGHEEYAVYEKAMA